MTGFQLFSQTAPALGDLSIVITGVVVLIAWIVSSFLIKDPIWGLLIGFFSGAACALLLHIPQTFEQNDLDKESDEVNVATFEEFYGVEIEKNMRGNEEEALSFNSLRGGQLTEPFKVKSESGETFEVVVKVVDNEGFAYLYDGKLTPLEPVSKEVTLK